MTDRLRSTIVDFLVDIGLPVEARTIDVPGSMPGISVEHGAVVHDPSVVIHPGDLLHEAGHVALLPPSVRPRADGRLEDVDGSGYELGAICWSVAAATHLGLDLSVVFHAEGYRGEGDHLADQYRSGVAPGLPLLVWAGLAWSPGQEPPGEQPFPAMRRWVRVDEAPTDP